MKPRTRILRTLAEQFAARKVGRTGAAANHSTFDLDRLLLEANCGEGDQRELAEHDLREAERAGILQCVPLHKRDPNRIARIRVPLENEAALFAAAGLPSPTEQRTAFAAQFAAAAQCKTPEQWKRAWEDWCERKRVAALSGEPIAYFTREDLRANQELLDLLPKLLSWEGESLVRFTSCVLCGNSKSLEEMAAKEKDGDFRGKLRGKLGKLLEEITGSKIRTLDDLGILPNPRFVLLCGPLKLRLDGEWLNLGLLNGAFRLSETDIERAESITTTARRCLTIENETSFHELAKLQSGELLIQTSYPGSATVKLLRRLPNELEFWHFGDSDEDGFAIVADLRTKSGRDVQPLHMQHGRIPFEQEALGRPRLKDWPFYG